MIISVNMAQSERNDDVTSCLGDGKSDESFSAPFSMSRKIAPVTTAAKLTRRYTRNRILLFVRKVSL
jgi:hypothetical protein